MSIDTKHLIAEINKVESAHAHEGHRGSVLDATDDEINYIHSIVNRNLGPDYKYIAVSPWQYNIISEYAKQQRSLKSCKLLLDHADSWVNRRANAYLQNRLVTN